VTVGADLVRALQNVTAVRLDEPLSRHTTIGIGGPADAYLAPESCEQLVSVLGLARESETPVFMLGSGSNIVVGDRGLRGLVIENKACALGEPLAAPSGRGDGESCYVFRAESGCSFAGVARQLAFGGYAGLEWACGIPGTIGGAVVYNAGAYGGCLADVLQSVTVWDGGEVTYPAGDLGLVYRGSDFTRGRLAGRPVLSAVFALWPSDAAALRARVADFDERRLKAQPRGRNAGSFFKNPSQQPAWRLIDAVGLRGYRLGGAAFSEKHCNFLINAGGATAADVAALMRLAQQRVRDEFGIELENEVTLVGEGFGDE
jgi:UDP-N-acetylmuramate dehydrogenase